MQNLILTPVSVEDLVNLIANEIELRMVKEPQKKEQVKDEMDIDETVKMTGLKKSAIYRNSWTGDMPCFRRGKRLVFSRKEIRQWLDDRTIRKTGISQSIAKHLAEVAESKL